MNIYRNHFEVYINTLAHNPAIYITVKLN